MYEMMYYMYVMMYVMYVMMYLMTMYVMTIHICAPTYVYVMMCMTWVCNDTYVGVVEYDRSRVGSLHHTHMSELGHYIHIHMCM